MPSDHISRPTTGRCRECRRNRGCFSVRRLMGGGYNRAPRHGSAMLCVDCIGEFAPATLENKRGYIGADRWDRVSVLSHARDMFVPLREQEARRSVAHASWDVRA